MMRLKRRCVVCKCGRSFETYRHPKDTALCLVCLVTLRREQMVEKKRSRCKFCGDEFRQPKKAKRVTCSDLCHRMYLGYLQTMRAKKVVA